LGVPAHGGSPLGRWLLQWGRTLARSIPAFMADRGLILAAAVSYYLVISLFPLILLLIALSGLVLEDGSVQSILLRRVAEYLPGSEIVVATAINTVILARSSLGGLAVLGLLWTALGLCSVIEEAINTAWGVRTRRSVWRSTLVGLAMLGTLTVALLASIAISSLLGVFTATPAVPRLSAVAPLGTLVSIAAPAIGFMLLYRFLPVTIVRWADVWPAALAVAALWEAGKTGFLWYLSIADYSSVYGQVGAVVALLVWGHLSGVLLIWGAELCSEHARARDVIPRRDIEVASR
jgi:membrane protein